MHIIETVETDMQRERKKKN